MMPSWLKLLVFGLLDITVVSWIVVSSIKTGAAPLGGAFFARRDTNPMGFWLSIGIFVFVGLMLLAAIVDGLFDLAKGVQP